MSVIMEAYVNGVSTRKVERLAVEMGLDGIDKSAVSRINKGLMNGFRHSFSDRWKGTNMYTFQLMLSTRKFGRTVGSKARRWWWP